jgi:hypothetical protein
MKRDRSSREGSLTASEALAIIEACVTAGVTELTFRGLEVSFSGGRLRWTEPKAEELTPPVVAAAAQTDQETLEVEELEVRAQQVAELHLTDPLEFEKMLERGELEDVNMGPEQAP